MSQPVNDRSAAFRRRGDGVLEMLPRLDPIETARRAEIAIAVLFVSVGGGAVLVRNVPMAILLLAGGAAMVVPRIVRAALAARGDGTSNGGAPASAPGNEAGRRIVHLEEYVVPARCVAENGPDLSGSVSRQD